MYSGAAARAVMKREVRSGRAAKMSAGGVFWPVLRMNTR